MRENDPTRTQPPWHFQRARSDRYANAQCGNHMRRREFIGAAVGAFVLRPRIAHAQSSGLLRIGTLRPLPPTAFPETLDAFKEGLAQFGYVEGRNLGVEHRWSTGHYEQLPALAAELVQRQVSL